MKLVINDWNSAVKNSRFEKIIPVALMINKGNATGDRTHDPTCEAYEKDDETKMSLKS
jgi:hypothetical protein